MADAKISALTAASAAAGANEFPINEGGTTKKLTLTQILTYLTSAFSSFTMAGVTNVVTLRTYEATVTIGAAATTAKEAAINMPANFLPMFVGVHVTAAAANAVNLNDIGFEGDTDGFVDGAAIAVNATGFKGFLACNGVRGNPGGTTNTGGSVGTPDEVSATVSGVPGGTGVTLRFTFYGVAGS